MDGMRIPLGCKFTFDPKDDELLVYLKCKTNGETLPGEGFIKEVDLYSLNDPGVLFKGTDEKLVYVFTKLKKVAKNGKRVERTVSGNRTWKGVDAGKPIHNAEGCPVGEKKNFALMNKMKMNLGYNMTEFSLDKDILRNSRFQGYVVCKIKKKAKKFRGLNDENLPEGNQDSPVSTPATEGVDGMPSVFTPAIEGDAMVPVSEEGYQYEGNSIALNQCQYLGEQQETQEYYQFSESNGGMGNFMGMACQGFDNDKVFSEGYQYGEVNSWTTETRVEESNQLSISWNDLFGPKQDQQEAEGMIEELHFAGSVLPSSPVAQIPWLEKRITNNP